jgi:hypothetical protein
MIGRKLTELLQAAIPRRKPEPAAWRRLSEMLALPGSNDRSTDVRRFQPASTRP